MTDDEELPPEPQGCYSLTEPTPGPWSVSPRQNLNHPNIRWIDSGGQWDVAMVYSPADADLIVKLHNA